MQFREELIPASLSGLGESDRTEIAALIEREEVAVLGEPDSTREDLDLLLDGPEAAPDAGVLLRAGSRLVGLVMFERRPEAREVFLDVHIPPELTRGQRNEVRARLTALGVDRATELAVDDDGAPPGHVAMATDVPGDPLWDADPGVWQLFAGTYAQDHEAIAALSAAGFRHVRTFTRMRIDPGAGYTAGPAPPGVRLRQVAGDDDLVLAHRIYAESFVDHWGHAPRQFDSWIASERAQPGFDVGQWLIAEFEGAPCGICLMSDARLESGYGYVATLGVVGSARGRGIASHLLQTAFQMSAARGLSGTELSVDSASPTGADKVYRKVGMITYREIQVWLRSPRSH